MHLSLSLCVRIPGYDQVAERVEYDVRHGRLVAGKRTQDRARAHVRQPHQLVVATHHHVGLPHRPPRGTLSLSLSLSLCACMSVLVCVILPLLVCVWASVRWGVPRWGDSRRYRGRPRSSRMCGAAWPAECLHPTASPVHRIAVTHMCTRPQQRERPASHLDRPICRGRGENSARPCGRQPPHARRVSAQRGQARRRLRVPHTDRVIAVPAELRSQTPTSQTDMHPHAPTLDAHAARRTSSLKQ
jgi:hypothetical protein